MLSRFHKANFLFALGLFVGALLLGGCVTSPPPQTVVIKELNVPLRQIKKAVASALPGGIRRKSDNGRTFDSHYISMSGKRWDPLSTERERAWASVTILGDRRPYRLEILVSSEVRETKDPLDLDFKPYRRSKKWGRRISERIVDYLKNKKKNSIFDDFRAF